MPNLLNWHQIDSFGTVNHEGGVQRSLRAMTYRAKVPGGWLVVMFLDDKEARKPGALPVQLEFSSSNGLAFVPDRDHQWNLAL